LKVSQRDIEARKHAKLHKKIIDFTSCLGNNNSQRFLFFTLKKLKNNTFNFVNILFILHELDTDQYFIFMNIPKGDTTENLSFLLSAERYLFCKSYLFSDVKIRNDNVCIPFLFITRKKSETMGITFF